jgi:hypothetical protein
MSDFKAGDKAIYLTDIEVEVVALTGRFAWVAKPNTPENPFTVHRRDLRKPKPPFFEVGKTYTYTTQWSIQFQDGPLRVFFEPVTVVEESDGNPVAFGKVFNSKNTNYKYTTHSLYAYRGFGFEEVKP